MVTLKFYSIKDRHPKPSDEQVIYLKSTSSFGLEGYGVREAEIEYSWDDIDEDGEFTGTSFSISDNDRDLIESGELKIGDTLTVGEYKVKLSAAIDGVTIDEDLFHYTTHDEYWKSFDHLEKLN